MEGQKCEHAPCTCYVDLGQRYCNERCRERDAADGDATPHERCGCRHAECISGD